MRIALFIIGVSAASAFCQSFNLSIEGDQVVPASDFAAAGRPGYWNNFSGAAFGEPRSLLDHTGLASDVTLTVTDLSGLGAGDWWCNDDDNTGDYAALMNDSMQFTVPPGGGHFVFEFDGLLPGDYSIWTYACAPCGADSLTSIFVDGALNENPQLVRGPAPANTFELGITHSRHDVSVSDGTLVVRFDVPEDQQEAALVNGFQLLPVPTPGACSLIVIAGTVCRRRRA